MIIERDNLEEFFYLRLYCSKYSRTIVLIIARSAEIKGEICAREGGREGGKEGGRKEGRKGGRKGGREKRREGGREKRREGEIGRAHV